MLKNEMLKKVAELSGLTQNNVDIVLTAYADAVVGTLTQNRDEKVNLPGIGTFSVKHVPERSGVTALAGSKVWTKQAHDEIVFKISKSVKELADWR